jgi:inner membrane protein
MDSLSQIVLGAAVGEAVLGRRIGNRAMIWGAVAGTIPDMDVLGKYFLSELDNLAFHRGISHSLLFCLIGSVVFGWVTDRLYRSRHHAWLAIGTKAAAAVVVGFVVNFLTQIFAPGAWWPVAVYGALIAFWLWKHGQSRYFEGNWEAPDADVKGWVLLFFWGFLTHILLDCFTTYGTQVFAPFSNERVAWGTVSVVDPLYTMPFLLCLLVAARFVRHDSRRQLWNRLGLAWSCLYLALTVVNHSRVQHTVEAALQDQGRSFEQFLITPTIFNNLLWNVVVDAGDEFLLAQHSILDEIPVAFYSASKGYDLLHNMDADETIGVLQWFSAGYLNAVRRNDGSLQLNDLRFGTFSGTAKDADDYIFRFKLIDRGPQEAYGFERAQGGPPDEKAEDMMMELFDRASGRAIETPMR